MTHPPKPQVPLAAYVLHSAAGIWVIVGVVLGVAFWPDAGAPVGDRYPAVDLAVLSLVAASLSFAGAAVVAEIARGRQ